MNRGKWSLVIGFQINFFDEEVEEFRHQLFVGSDCVKKAKQRKRKLDKEMSNCIWIIYNSEDALADIPEVKFGLPV